MKHGTRGFGSVTLQRWAGVVAALGMMAVSLSGGGASTNVLLIVMDDVGTDALRLYHQDPEATYPATPQIDALAAQGIVFRNAYSYPTCSPTRSTILTGRYGFRTGIGYAIANAQKDPVLKAVELTLPEILTRVPPTGVRCASFGKWHLSFGDDEPRTLGGWEHFSGVIAGALPDYFRWPKTVNGQTQPLWQKYATTDNVDDALTWLGEQGAQPWFLWLAVNAAHTPYHKPPEELHTRDSLPDSQVAINARPRPYYEAMVEALDTELGRLLQAVDRATTTIIVLGDNGTLATVIQPPYPADRGKGTLYQGGIRVPLIVAGAGVVAPGRVVTSTVGTVDLFATILELAGQSVASSVPSGWPVDSRSLMPILRNEPFQPGDGIVLSENFAEGLDPEHAGRAATDGRYKLHRLDVPREEFYDLQEDPLETRDLLTGLLSAEQEMALTALRNRLDAWVNLPTAPSIRDVTRAAESVTVSIAEAYGTRARLWRSDSAGGAWEVVEDAVIQSAEGIVTLTDGHALERFAFYRVSLDFE